MSRDAAPPRLEHLPPPAGGCTCSGRPHPRTADYPSTPLSHQNVVHFEPRVICNPRRPQTCCRMANVALFYTFVFLLSQMLSLSSASSIRQIGEAALCPFEAKQDRDDTRMPATITQLTCKHAKSVIANVDGSGASMGVSCEQIGGTCKQIHTILGVSYKQSATNRSSRSLQRPRRSLRRHHNIRVNSACVCVLSNGKPAVPVSPGYEARR